MDRDGLDRWMTVLIFLSAVLVLSGLAGVNPAAGVRGTDHARPPSGDTRSLAVNAINVFGLKMYAKLRRGNENLVISPFSVFCPLALAYSGARGRTREEMAEVLGVDRTNTPVHSTLRSLTLELKTAIAREYGELGVANSLWVDKRISHSIRKEFRDRAKKDYNASIRSADFLTDPVGAAWAVNQWISKVTRGRIPQMVSPQQVTNEQWAVAIVNAIYFYGTWAMPFDVTRTVPKPFTLMDGTRFNVPMMFHSSKRYRYMEEADFQALEMPYKGDRLSMVVFLPSQPKGLPELEKRFTAETAESWFQKLSSTAGEVYVDFPKFEMRSRLGLIETLKSMGMKAAFVRGANFSGIAPDLLPITAVAHEAWIDVNEKGTEAAAATRVAIPISRPRIEPKIFRADHPFLFVIRHRATNCILFMGRVTDPRGGRARP